MTTATTHGITTLLVPITDVAAAKAVYSALLGTDPVVDDTHYVGFQVGEQHVGLLPDGGPQHLSAPLAYWRVADMDATVASMVAAGGTVTEAAHEVGGGRTVATVTDADGNPIGLSHDA